MSADRLLELSASIDAATDAHTSAITPMVREQAALIEDNHALLNQWFNRYFAAYHAAKDREDKTSAERVATRYKVAKAALYNRLRRDYGLKARFPDIRSGNGKCELLTEEDLKAEREAEEQEKAERLAEAAQEAEAEKEAEERAEHEAWRALNPEQVAGTLADDIMRWSTDPEQQRAVIRELWVTLGLGEKLAESKAQAEAQAQAA